MADVGQEARPTDAGDALAEPLGLDVSGLGRRHPGDSMCSRFARLVVDAASAWEGLGREHRNLDLADSAH
jgi:hypothetical protein